MQYAYQYDNSVQGCSYEYMQCIGNCLTREILEDHIYNDIPQREYIIEGLFKSNIYNKWEWWSVFTYEGLIEFMETGNIQNFPYQLYRKPDMKVRCELLENAIKMTKKREFCYYMIKSDKMYSMKEYYLEMYLKARVSINFYNEVGSIGRFVFENPIIAGVFEEMNGYLEKIGYIYSHEKTCEIMQKVLEEYKAKI